MKHNNVHLVLVGGLAGTGKSDVSRELARLTGFALYDKDTGNGPMVDKWLKALGSNEADRESQIYLEKVRPIEYLCMMNAVRESIGLGISTIATAPFIQEINHALWRAETKADFERTLGRPVAMHYVWVHTSEEVMHRRLVNRRAARDTYKLAHWDEFMINMRKIRPLQPCFELNCSADFETEQRARDIMQRFRLDGRDSQIGPRMDDGVVRPFDP